MNNTERMENLIDLCMVIEKQTNYVVYFEKSRLNVIDITIFDSTPLIIKRYIFSFSNHEMYCDTYRQLIEFLGKTIKEEINNERNEY